jgi:hypothetical protein
MPMPLRSYDVAAGVNTRTAAVLIRWFFEVTAILCAGARGRCGQYRLGTTRARVWKF